MGEELSGKAQHYTPEDIQDLIAAAETLVELSIWADPKMRVDDTNRLRYALERIQTKEK